MNCMKVHINDKIKNMCKSAKAEVISIAGGFTKILQLRDIGINKSFKSKI